MEVGRIIGGKYRLQHEIGEGAMGAVWAGVHELLERSVAIKFMLPAVEDATTAAARFVAEAKAAAQIKHRFVVDVFDFGITDDGLYYMVQELLDGESLGQTMDQGPAWPVQDVVRFAAQCLSGLTAVHKSGVVHRDLKPENIFVMPDADGRFPKLLDFGISKAAGAPAERVQARSAARASVRTGRMRHLTALGATLGTPAYMSPEQLRNQSDLDARADLYSMGVVLYEWLSGRCPYASTHDYAALDAQIRARSMTPLAKARPDLSPALCSVVERALSPEANERFSSAGEMREALLATLPTLSAALAVVQSPSAKAARLGQKTQLLLESADAPFADSEPPTFLPRFSLARLSFVGTALSALLLVVWLVARGEDTTSSHAEPASVRAAPAPPPPVAAPATVGERSRAGLETLPVAADMPGADLPVGADMPGADLPVGADMPDEDLPIRIPESSPERRSATRQETTGREPREGHKAGKAHSSAGDRKPLAPAQSASPGSSPGGDRPIRQKVVRQLDF